MKTLKSRFSNIELLRIISMFGVLIVHSDFGALGWPTQTELISSPFYTITRTFIESLSIVAVNIFILISGWFGINFRWSSLAKLLFQCAFFFFGIYIIGRILGIVHIGFLKGIYMCLMMSENAWFVKCYIGMFIFAPIMNNFIEYSSQKQIKIFLISFFLFQTIYGWISNGASFIKDGYSTFSFMGLYILARYVHLYKPSWSNLSISKDIIIYITLSTISAIGLISFTYLNNPYSYIFTKYSSPLIIGAALFLLLAFSKFSFNNKFINWIASSCFAVYLFHFIIFPQYMSPWIRSIAVQHDGIDMVCLILLLLVTFYIAAIGIDKIRIIIWKSIFAKYFNR